MSKREYMEKIIDLVNNCKKCILHSTRNKPVIGKGSFHAKIMFIGEAPGRNEDFKGKPFVGKAGKILDDLLNSIGLKKNEIYISNIIKCRPPNNRNPLEIEIKMCSEFLDKQIEIIHPEIIVPLGKIAISYIFKKFGLKFEKIRIIHGMIFLVKTNFGTLKIIPIYHPAAAIYNINIKNILFADFKIIKNNL